MVTRNMAPHNMSTRPSRVLRTTGFTPLSSTRPPHHETRLAAEQLKRKIKERPDDKDEDGISESPSPYRIPFSVDLCIAHWEPPFKRFNGTPPSGRSRSYRPALWAASRRAEKAFRASSSTVSIASRCKSRKRRLAICSNRRGLGRSIGSFFFTTAGRTVRK